MEKQLEHLKKYYLKKNSDNTNVIYKLVNEINDYVILHIINLLTMETINIIAVPKGLFSINYVSTYDFLKGAKRINKAGSYTSDFNSIFLYKNKVIVYKDENFELLYDTKIKKMLIIPSIYDSKDFVSSLEQPNLELIDLDFASIK